MNDAVSMRRIQSIRDLDAVVQNFLEVERAPADPLLKGFALKKLKHEEGGEMILADVVKSADVGMIQRGGGAGLTFETLAGFGFTRLRRLVDAKRGEEFQRDHAAQTDVFGLVDHTHATRAERFDDLIAADGGAEERIRLLLVQRCCFGLDSAPLVAAHDPAMILP